MKSDETKDLPSFAQPKPKTCNVNPIAKYIRIALSLGVIALGIIYRNPVGLLGLLTLFTALTGSCGSYSLFGFSRKPDLKIKLDNLEDKPDDPGKN